MAGDWIPMRLDLHEDPAVIQLAELMGCNEREIVGYLLQVWSWVSRQCHADSVTNVTTLSLGRVTGTGQFCDHLVTVGWLKVVTIDGVPGIEIPNFDRWLCKTAKKRLIDAKRQQSRRKNVTKMSRSQRDKTRTESVTTGQDRTVLKGECFSSKRSDARFTPPTVAEVQAYADSKGWTVDAQEFCDFYHSKGWVVGKVKMKSWQSALSRARNWESNQKNQPLTMPEDF